MQSAFGVDHPGVIFKADDRAKHYRRTANTFGALGATTAALGTGSGVVGHLESKGHDPMGFTMRENWKDKPKSPAHRARILQINRAAHGRQAKIAAGLSAASLGVAGAYKVKQKKAQVSKGERTRRVTDAAAGTGAIGVGGAAVGGGGYMAHGLGRAAYAHADNVRVQAHNLRSVKQGRLKMGKKEAEWAKHGLKTSRRVVGVKGAGAAAGVGIAGLGVAGIHHGAKSFRKNPS